MSLTAAPPPGTETIDAPAARRDVAIAATLAVVAAAIVLLMLARPSASNYRDVDEPGYAAGGLVLAEGSAPPYRAAPAGPLTWAGWGWANAHAAARVVGLGDAAGRAEVAAAPAALKPYVALNAVLFDAYRDGRPLRAFILAVGFAVWAAGAAAAAGLGWRHARLPGALLVGGLWATLPLFVDLATQTRPYAWAWAFAGVAVWLADRARSRRGELWCALAYGLAVGSRVDMLALLPLLLCFLHRPGEGFRRLAARTFGLLLRSAAVTLIVAPWLVTSLLSNIKSILAVYVVRVAGATPGLGRSVVQITWWQGLGPTLLLVAVGLTLAATRKGPGQRRAIALAAVAVWAFVSALRQTGYGLHHNGWAVVVLVLCAAPAAGALRQWWATRGRSLWPAAAVVAAAVGLPLAQTLIALPTLRPPTRADAAAVAWLEQNLPAGAAVYQPQMLVNPLPTVESARRQWQWFNDEGWRRKLAWGLGKLGADADATTLAGLPPAAADDTAIKERFGFRAMLILGSRPDVSARRFDVRQAALTMTMGDWLQPRPATRPADDAAPAAVTIQVGPPLTEFGPPLAQWPDGAGGGTFLYRAAAP